MNGFVIFARTRIINIVYFQNVNNFKKFFEFCSFFPLIYASKRSRKKRRLLILIWDIDMFSEYNP